MRSHLRQDRASRTKVTHRQTSGVLVLAIALSIAASIVANLDASVAEERSENQPNILIIVTDDQRGGMRVMPRTRKIFRRGGTRFPNAFVTTPVCCPSRASIFTGRYAHNHGVESNLWRDGTANFDARGALPHLLHRAGYRTGLIGKFLNSWPLKMPPPDFDEYLKPKGNAYYDGTWDRNGAIEENSGYSTQIMADAAVDFIERQASGPSPWFLHLATVAPHPPFTPEHEYARAEVDGWAPNPAHRPEASRGKPQFVRRSKKTFKEGNAVRVAQLRTLKSVDDLVGRVFDTLEATGQDRHTFAFFISDNGMMWGEYGLLNKGVPYTPSVGVPMMLRWPERIGAGTVDGRLVANIDIAPTVLEATGLEPLENYPVDGRSLLDPTWVRKRILLEYWRNIHARRPWASLRTKRWQYTEYYDRDTGKRYFQELYKHRQDPWQLNNLLWKRKPPQRPNVNWLTQRLARDRVCRGTTGPNRCP